MSSQTETLIPMISEAGFELELSAFSNLPKVQNQLLLHKVRQPYAIHRSGDVPRLGPGELLIEIHAIGLNPIDWKSAFVITCSELHWLILGRYCSQYGFALPALPCLNGREFVGRVVARHEDPNCYIRNGDMVLAVSTDYRDFRKSAFQEYAVASCFNTTKIPEELSNEAPRIASLGVAFVAASLSLGICFGIDFPATTSDRYRSLSALSQSQQRDQVPADVQDEVFNAISAGNSAHAGEWVLIYGASSITGQLCVQLAKLARLKVVAVANVSRHQDRLNSLGADLVVDRENLEMAAREIRKVVPGSLRFAIDTIGKESAQWCQNVLASRAGSLPHSPVRCGNENLSVESGAASQLSHLVCLTGKPSVTARNVRIHAVPIKLFHTNPELGREVSDWLYTLMGNGQLKLPETHFVEGGLDVINGALDTLKKGQLSGKRLVVIIRDEKGRKKTTWPPEHGGFCWC